MRTTRRNRRRRRAVNPAAARSPPPGIAPNSRFGSSSASPTRRSTPPGRRMYSTATRRGRRPFSPQGLRSASSPECPAPLCVQLGGLTLVSGNYTVSSDVSLAARYPLDDGAAIPVRVEYDPVANTLNGTEPQAFPICRSIRCSSFRRSGPTLRLERWGWAALHARSTRPRFRPGSTSARCIRSRRSTRSFRRVPTRARRSAPRHTRPSSSVADDFILDSKSLDPDVGADGHGEARRRPRWLLPSRSSTADSKRRVSTLKTLAGTSATLHARHDGRAEIRRRRPRRTTSRSSSRRRRRSLAVPTYVTRGRSSAGSNSRSTIRSSPTPRPSSASSPSRRTVTRARSSLAIRHSITFESSTIATARGCAGESPLLHYIDERRHRRSRAVRDGASAGHVQRDDRAGGGDRLREVAADRGRRQSCEDEEQTALTLQPPPRTKVTWARAC